MDQEVKQIVDAGEETKNKVVKPKSNLQRVAEIFGNIFSAIFKFFVVIATTFVGFVAPLSLKAKITFFMIMAFTVIFAFGLGYLVGEGNIKGEVEAGTGVSYQEFRDNIDQVRDAL